MARKITAIDHTFIIPAYKNSSYIEDCIISLIEQTVQSKILITTSTPSDFLSDIAKNYNIGIEINTDRKNIAADWNFAYRKCKTKYLTIAHQDDVYLPEYTERCLASAEKPVNRNNLITFTDYKEYKFDKPRKNSFLILIKRILLLQFLFKYNIESFFLKRIFLLFGNPVSCPTVMFNVENIGAFEFSEEYHYNMDWDAWLRLSRMNGKFIYINRKLMIHRLHGESQTAIQIANMNRLKEEEKIFLTIWSKPISKILTLIYRLGSNLNRSRY